MILVTGLSGMVGKYLKQELEQAGLDYFALSRNEIDLRNLSSIDTALKGKKFTHFIHLAAETNVDLCETSPEHAYTCNYYATKKIAEYCEKVGARFIFISTSGVFGSEGKLIYCELDSPSPVSIYGKSKYMSEKTIQHNCSNYLIIRASWMIGGGQERDNKFVGKVISQLKTGTKKIQAVCDKFGSITSARHLAKFIVKTLDNAFTGIKHFSSYDFCSRYEIAKLIVNELKAPCQVTPTRSATFPLAAPRPISEALYSIVPEELIASENYSWAEAISTYLKEEFNA